MTDSKNKKKIWALFHIANEYDQPDNNLMAWWEEKPSFDAVSKGIGFAGFPCGADADTLLVINVWQGLQGSLDCRGTYRLEEIAEGSIL